MWAHLLELQPQTGKVGGGRHRLRAGASAQSAAAGAKFPGHPGRAARSRRPRGPQAHTCVCCSPEPCSGFRGLQQWHQPRRLHRPGGQGHRKQDASGLRLGPCPEAARAGDLPHVGGAPAGAGALQQAGGPDGQVPGRAAEGERGRVPARVPAWVPAWARPPSLSAGLRAQALAGEVGMSSELDDVARSLFVGQIPNIWRKLAPDTLKSLGNWMLYFLRRFSQYTSWVSERQGPSAGSRCSRDPPRPPPDPFRPLLPPQHQPPVAADGGLS